MLGITGAFSSLGINERAQETSGRKCGKNGSTVSLPNMVLSSERLSISSKFMNVCDDEETTEQPVDFSKKYCETKLKNGTRSCTFNKVVKSYNNSFTMYAETDLDQPTDYSLRYAEDDSDSDRCPKIVKNEPNEFVQDTIKTYCTEDTPYETPFNFSTSTSMSDLRIDDKAPVDAKLAKNVAITSKEISVPPGSKIKSEFSSGVMSPEKPVNYCDEGTPGYFSRVASCGSLNSIPANDPPKKELKLEVPETGKKDLRRLNKFTLEPKAVKFEDVVNYAEETPLMFSRSSSLASLDSIEQHSIHDDRSSVVSDFSRLTSGVISPSELPDSPSQTVPPSPKPRKTVAFPVLLKKKPDEASQAIQNEPKSSVFEDVVKKYKVESTPLHFSLATSLSSLVDEEVDNTGIDNDKSVEKEAKNDLNDLSDNSEDEDILAACINIGMQSNRYSQLKDSEPVQKSDVTCDSLRTYCTEGTPAILSHAGSNSDLSLLSMHLSEKGNFEDRLGADKNELLDSVISNIDNRTSCSVSAQKPNGDLKISIDLPPTNHTTQSRRSSFSSLSDDSHESEQALLEECILAGMPKSSSPSKPVITDPSEVPDTEIKSKEENDSSDDDAILDDVINMGINSNRYSKPTSSLTQYQKLNNVVGDSVRSYFTEDTPAILSHAGSCSNLSVLSVQGDDVKEDSDLSDEDEEKLLEECVKFGMAAIAKKMNNCHIDKPGESGTRRIEVNKNEAPSNYQPRSSPSLSSSSSSSSDILQQCIDAGMPKPNPKPRPHDDLTPGEKALLQQCILEGMAKCRNSVPKRQTDESSDLTEAEHALLRQCILSGMPKTKVGGASKESAELSQSERLLLQQCILAGMPKKGRGKYWTKKEHTCCVHCPKNKKKEKKRVKREVYVTGHVVVKEVVERINEKWV